ncbi:PKD domain-containing protein [uncultured Microscilla sp.]|uniref:T9SS type A sorting domain-containing protein n=1 Tax=uncultured Microscilla sp. TaxID=432653 RepID=UPI00261E9FB4|nr:PKD domain-containing protein [uncultured Microscilla sp.]
MLHIFKTRGMKPRGKLIAQAKNLLYTKTKYLLLATCITLALTVNGRVKTPEKTRAKKSALFAIGVQTPTVELCAGTGAVTLDSIIIYENNIDDFWNWTFGETMEISLGDETNFTLSGTPTVYISPGVSDATINARIENNKLKFDYNFVNRATLDSIIITGLQVEALPTASTASSTTLSVTAGIGDIVGFPLATTLANINLKVHPATPSFILGANNVFAGEAVNYYVPTIANADEYEWDIPAELNGGTATVTNTGTNNFIALTVHSVTSTSTVNLRVRGKNTTSGCDGAYASYPITVNPVGVLVTPGSLELCKGGSTQVLPDIKLNEQAKTDFSASDNLILSLGSTDYTFSGPITVTVNGSSTGISTTVSAHSIEIGYDFTSGYDATTDEMVISGLQITANGSAAGMAELKATGGTSGLASVDGTTVFATVTANDPPVQATNIVGPSVIYSGESITFSVDAITGVNSYDWDLPAELNGGTAGVVNTTTNAITLTTQTVSTTTAVSISVKGKKTGCVDGAYSAPFHITINPTGVEVTPSSVTICRGGSAKTLPDIVVTERFLSDFMHNPAGSNTLILSLSNTDFTLGGNPTVTVTNTSGTSSFSTSFGGAGNLRINYDFATDTESQNNIMTISGLEVSANTSAATSVNLTPNSGTAYIEGVTTSTVFATVNTAAVPAQAPAFVASVSTLCVGTPVTFTIDSIPSAVTYEWQLPAGVNVAGSSTDSTIALTATSDAVNGVVRVRGVSSEGCAGAWLEQNVTIRSVPTAGTIEALTSNALCAGQSATFFVSSIEGATNYEWVLPTELAEAGAAHQDTVVTSNSLITLTASSAVTSITSVDIKVRGVNTDCGEGAFSSLYTITVNPLPVVNLTMALSGGGGALADGAAHPSNGVAIDLTGAPTGGVFSGNGVVGTQFNPGLVGVGVHQLRYTYTDGSGCAGADSVTINVTNPTSVSGLASGYCKDDNVPDAFEVQKIISKTSNKIVYIQALEQVNGLSSSGGPVSSSRPFVICNAGLIGQSDATLNYRFTPSLTSTEKVYIRAFIHEVDNSSGSPVCNTTRIDTLATVDVSPLPNPVIKDTNGTICADNATEYYYAITNPDPAHSYQWSINSSGVGTIIPQKADSVISIRWQGDGSHQLTVTETVKATGCKNDVSIPVTVRALPATPVVVGEDNVCANSLKGYKVTSAGATSFQWSVTNGSIQNGQNTDSITVQWLGVSGNVVVEAFNGFGCKTSAARSVTVSAPLTPVISVGATSVCAGATSEVYETVLSQGGTVQWIVTGGEITTPGAVLQTDGSYTMSGTTQIEVNWGTGSSGSVTVVESVGSCTGQASQRVTINPLPSLKISGLTSSILCKQGNSITLKGALSASDLPAGQTGTFTITKQSDGSKQQFPSTNQYVIDPTALAIDKYDVKFEYQDPNSCLDSVKTAFEIIATPTVNFTGIDPPTVKKYCVSAKAIALTPTVDTLPPSPASNGQFTIKKIGASDSLNLGKGQHTFDASALQGEGVYNITYRFTTGNGCVATSAPQAFELVGLPDLKVLGVSANGYCVRNATTVRLYPEINSVALPPDSLLPLDSVGTYYMIRRVSLPRTNYEYLVAGDTLTNVFNPSHPIPSEAEVPANASVQDWNKLAGEYEVIFAYTDGDGCVNTSQNPVTIVVNRLPELSFTGLSLSKAYCGDVAQVPLTPLDRGVEIPSSVEFKYRAVTGTDTTFQRFTGGNSFTPNQVPPGEYEIMLKYTTNPEGCADSITVGGITVTPTPQNMQITASQNYGSDTVRFTATAFNTGPSGFWAWDFKDGTASTDQNPDKLLGTVLPKIINYSVTASTGTCDTTVTKTFRMEFDYSGQCAGSATNFVNTSLLSDATGTVSWSFGDGSPTVTGDAVSHQYQTPGTYWVTLNIVTQDGVASYTLRRRIDIFPMISVTQQAFYHETFESGTGGWISHGVVEVNLIPVDSTSWQLKQPDGFLISNPNGQAWVTDNRNNPYRADTNANYNSNEQSYVESPCFDIAGLNKPMISFRYWSDTEQGADGVVLLYTIDDGKTWLRLGSQGLGIDWYDTKPILGSPGSASDGAKVSTNPDNQGWSGKSQLTNGEWLTARYSLTEVLIKMQELGLTSRVVRFRMSFGSNGDNPATETFDGFAFDDVKIGNRNRIVLLEYFINQGVANAAAQDLEAKNFPQTGNTNEIVKIHHHTGFPAVDVFNMQNEKDPSGRAFHQGIREVPRAVVDGYFKDTLIGQWTQDHFADRTLIISPFDISIGQANVNGQTLTVSTTVAANQVFSRPVVFHVVVVDSAVSTNGEWYYNVTRKMLPDAAGTYRGTPWVPGESQTLTFTWNKGDLDPAGFKIVVFVEDYVTKEIHQAGTGSVTSNRREDEGQSEHQVTNVDNHLLTGQAVVFPNPTTKLLHVKLETSRVLSAGATWQILSMNGKVLKKGQWQQGKSQMSINVGDLADGLYILRIVDQRKSIERRFEKQ